MAIYDYQSDAQKGTTLLMGVKRGANNRASAIEPASKEFIESKPRVISRDRKTCVSCNLTLEEHELQVHHVDDNHDNNMMHNLVTRCPLCHAVNHLNLIPRDMAYIIFFPVVDQHLINHLCLSLAIAKTYGGAAKEEADALHKLILERYTEPVLRVFGSYEPSLFGDVMLGMSDEEYNRREGSLSELRVFFNPDRLSKTAELLKSRHYEANPFELWKAVFESALRKADDKNRELSYG